MTDAEGRLRSAGTVLEGAAAPAPVEIRGAEDRGVVNVLLTLENNEVIRA